MDHDNGAIVQRFLEEVFNDGNLAVIDELNGERFTNFGRPGQGAELWRGIARMWRTAFPDVQVTIIEALVQGEVVAQRVTARGTHLGELRNPIIGVVPPTGRSFDGWDQAHFWRVSDGKIVEHWAVRNDLKLLRQLGVVPTLEQMGG